VKGPCEHGNELSGSVNDAELVDCKREYQFVKKSSAPIKLHSLMKFRLSGLVVRVPGYIKEMY
jgi:hypothetical protein